MSISYLLILLKDLLQHYWHMWIIISAQNDKEEIDQVKKALNKIFKIKDLGDLRYFLGLKLQEVRKG